MLDPEGAHEMKYLNRLGGLASPKGIGNEHPAPLGEILAGLAAMKQQPTKEKLNDVEGAYYDFRRALELKPDWDLAEWQLSRFEISTN